VVVRCWVIVSLLSIINMYFKDCAISSTSFSFNTKVGLILYSLSSFLILTPLLIASNNLLLGLMGVLALGSSIASVTVALAGLAAAVRTRAAIAGVRATRGVVAAAAGAGAASAATAGIRTFGASARHGGRWW